MLPFFALLATLFPITTTNAASTQLPSSCVDLQDGYHWIKILQDDTSNNIAIVYPAIHVLCSNNYMILDVNHDENIKSYFQSFDSYHYALSGANHQSSVNWKQWFIPSSTEHSPSFLLSPDWLFELVSQPLYTLLY